MPGKIKSAWDPGSQDPAYYAGLILAAIKIYEERTGLVHVNIAMMNIGHCHCTAPNTSEQCACSEEGRNKVQTLFEAAVAAFCLLT